MIEYVPKDGIVLSINEARRYVIGAAIVYFVLCLGLLFATWHWVADERRIATWQHAYCVQNAHLWAAEHGPDYLQDDLAGCA